jgi:hypothetical protein
MSHSHQVKKAINRAAARDRKRKPGMKVSGSGVFALQKLLRQRPKS